MNEKLKALRKRHGMTQREFSQKIKCTRSLYSLVETGKRKGSRDFWANVQTACNLSGGEVWEMMQYAKTNAPDVHDKVS